jgi:hypothetical protein
MLIARPLHAFVIPLRIVAGLNHSRAKAPSRPCAARFTKRSSLARCSYRFSNKGTRDNDGLQLRRAISIQVGGKRLLEKHAIAPSAARLC